MFVIVIVLQVLVLLYVCDIHKWQKENLDRIRGLDPLIRRKR